MSSPRDSTCALATNRRRGCPPLHCERSPRFELLALLEVGSLSATIGEPAVVARPRRCEARLAPVCPRRSDNNGRSKERAAFRRAEEQSTPAAAAAALIDAGRPPGDARANGLGD
ncbi:hypothetical protein HPB47_010205 [Ixodes persulcatus]|uniref:Uncharacterized protein n=1 Tax=Ixodes persulcatus TaxID=34615 RepID=A0AC60P002_IXOPE|nr:hypothetical protein HPB47_010205 [Ixodes persulcatus]